jgi:hypothetical protein
LQPSRSTQEARGRRSFFEGHPFRGRNRKVGGGSTVLRQGRADRRPSASSVTLPTASAIDSGWLASVSAMTGSNINILGRQLRISLQVGPQLRPDERKIGLTDPRAADRSPWLSACRGCDRRRRRGGRGSTVSANIPGERPSPAVDTCLSISRMVGRFPSRVRVRVQIVDIFRGPRPSRSLRSDHDA